MTLKQPSNATFNFAVLETVHVFTTRLVVEACSASFHLEPAPARVNRGVWSVSTMSTADCEMKPAEPTKNAVGGWIARTIAALATLLDFNDAGSGLIPASSIWTAARS